MPQFEYTRLVAMPARPGRSYATSYYKQTAHAHAELQAHVESVAQAILEATDANPDLAREYSQPRRDFRRSRPGEYYTVMEIIGDMLEQLMADRDCPSGMLGRWQRLFESTPYSIEMIPTGSQPINKEKQQ